MKPNQINPGEDKPEINPSEQPTRARAVRLGKKTKARLVQLELVSKKLVARLTEADKDQIVQVWREAMEANTHVYDMGTKTFVDYPDHRTRLAASSLAAAYVEGLPVQRSIIASAPVETWEQKLEIAKKSPEMLRMLLAGGVIDQAEYDHCIQQIDSSRVTAGWNRADPPTGTEKLQESTATTAP